MSVEAPVLTTLPAQPYQATASTNRDAETVLTELARHEVRGLAVTERAANYLVFQQPARHYPPELAAAVTACLVIVVLAFTAVSALFVALLPLAALPFLPMFFDHRPACAVSAIEDGDGLTRVVAHGEATAELVTALDEFLGSLPPPRPLEGATEGRGRQGASAKAGDLPVGAVRLPSEAGESATVPEAPPTGGAVVLFDPGSSTSREVCRLLDSRGVPTTTVRFLDHPPTRADLQRVQRLLKLDDPRGMMRTGQSLYKELSLAGADSGALIDALVSHPALLQRPIVIRDERAVIARPAARVLDLLDEASP